MGQRRFVRTLMGVLAVGETVGLFSPLSARAQQGDLETVRTDVRTAAPSEPSASGNTSSGAYHPTNPYNPNQEQVDKATGSLFVGGCLLTGYVALSPYWVPMSRLDDRLDRCWGFMPYPYAETEGYLFDVEAAEDYLTILNHPNLDRPDLLPGRSDLLPQRFKPRGWAGRAAVDYADNFDHLHRTSGSLLLCSTSRFGLDSQWDYFEEQLGPGHFDALHLGNVNFFFQFAQSERAMYRSGIGLNWLADQTDTDFGFNFTYAVDFFPQKPWILSAELDWGTLGRATRFHVRTTAGLIWRRFEAYTGFDYLSVGHGINTGSLIGGVRIWF